MTLFEQYRIESRKRYFQSIGIRRSNSKDNEDFKLNLLGINLKSSKSQVYRKHDKTRTGPTFEYQRRNISILKLNEALIWKISRCLKSEKWIIVGREIGIPHEDLEQIRANHKEDWAECAYRMLRLWNEQRPKCTLQDLFIALEGVKWKSQILEITKKVKRYLIHLPNKSENTPINKWRNLNPRIQQSILSKVALQCYLNCSQVSKHWMDKNREFFVSIMLKNCHFWSERNFINAMAIYRKRSEEKNKSQPAIQMKEVDIIECTHDVTNSYDKIMMEVGYVENITIQGLHDKTTAGSTFACDYQEISNIKIDESFIRKISKYVDDEKWIHVGRHLHVKDDELEEIKIKYKEKWRECAFQMLRLWQEQRPNSILQDLFAALETIKWETPIPDITKNVEKYLQHLPNKTENLPPINKWSNLNTRIIQSILSKMTLKCNFKCSQVSKLWMESEQEFYTWVKKNRDNWTKSSFKNVMKSNVDCKEIYWKSNEEWKRNRVPTLIKEINTLDFSKRNITISNDGTLLAVGSHENITIYNTKDLRTCFSRNFSDSIIHELYFNETHSFILVESDNKLHAVKVAEGLPTIQSVKCSRESVARPWCAENIFLSGNYDDKNGKTTFYLNEIGKRRFIFKRNTQHPILMVKGQTWGGIVQTDSCIVLVCKTDKTKLGFKTVSKCDLTTFQSKPQSQTPDQEVNCQGIIRNFIEVPDGKTKKLYILTKMKNEDYCFLIIDLDSFQLKTSTILVPCEFSPWRNLVSNAKYMASGSRSNCAFVWDIQSGLCIAQLNHEVNWVSCALHPVDPQLVITAGSGWFGGKIKLWRLNTDTGLKRTHKVV